MMTLDPFRKFLLVSFGIHVLLILLFVFSPNFQRPINSKAQVKWIKLSYGDGGTNIKANPKSLDHLPKSSLKNQTQALKDQAKAVDNPAATSNKNEQGKKIADVVVSNKQAVKDGGVNLNPKKTPPKPDIEDTTANALKRVASLQQQRKVEIGAAQVKEGDTGQSLQGGDEGSEEASELILYYNQVRQKISKEWFVIKSEFSGSLVARIVVRIDINGNIIDTNYRQSSGQGSFDESALRAIKKASPFPLPPESIRADLTQDGFEFVFNPKSVSGRTM